MKPELNKEAGRIAGMFDDIAPQYDFLNHFLSFGIDTYWRHYLVRHIARQAPRQVLDVATGTGDLAFLLARKTGATVTGIDISEGMLQIARTKAAKAIKASGMTGFVSGSATDLPFPDSSFDAVTVAFGVRNFEDLQQGLREMKRVLKPGGQLAVLEFTTPRRQPMSTLYAWYSKYLIPLMGRLVSRHNSAYTYLPASVAAFTQREELCAELQQAGLQEVKYKTLTCGICGFYTGTR